MHAHPRRTRGNTPEKHDRVMPKSPPVKSDGMNTSPARATLPAPKHSPVEAQLKAANDTNTSTRTSGSWICSRRVQGNATARHNATCLFR